MQYSKEEVQQFIKEEDVKFIRLAFCDVFGKQKNISILASEIDRAFTYGIAIDASSIDGFGDEVHSDLFLHPDPSTLVILPWRPEQGKVVRMFCDITLPDGTAFAGDTRQLLKTAIAKAAQQGYYFQFGTELEFYLFQRDAEGNPTNKPYDNAGYMDIAPEDKGENIRREICVMLEQMGICPESSHHEGGPGQNEIDFRYTDPLTAADNATTFCTVVKTVANSNGLLADFSPKPLPQAAGNGMHINFSVKQKEGKELQANAIAGVLECIADMTVFLNPVEQSYVRLGNHKAPNYISWSAENRSQLVRIPAATYEFRRAELRSPDPCANPYIAFTLLIHAALHGIEQQLQLPPETNINLYAASADILKKFQQLPRTLHQAQQVAKSSAFIEQCLPKMIIASYVKS